MGRGVTGEMSIESGRDDPRKHYSPPKSMRSCRPPMSYRSRNWSAGESITPATADRPARSVRSADCRMLDDFQAESGWHVPLMMRRVLSQSKSAIPCSDPICFLQH